MINAVEEPASSSTSGGAVAGADVAGAGLAGAAKLLPQRRSPQNIGILAACVGTAIWGSAAVLGKAISAPALVMLVWRQVIAGGVLGVLLVARRRPLRRVDLKASRFAAAMFGLHLIGFFGAARLTSVAIVVLIYALAPVIIIPLAAWKLGERPSRWMVGLAIVAIGGVGLVVSSGSAHGSHPGWGLVLSFGNLGLWVWWSLVLKRARSRDLDPLTWMFAANAGAFVVVLAAALASGQDLGAVRAGDWWRLVVLSLGSGLIGHGLNTWAYKHVSVGLVSVIGLGEPVLAALGAAVFLAEPLGPVQLTGIVIVIACVALAVTRAD